MPTNMESYLFQEKEYTVLEDLLEAMAGEEKRADYEEVCEFIKGQFDQEDHYYQKKYVLPMAEKILQGDDAFAFDGETFTDPDQLAVYLQGIADQSPAKLKTKGSRLFMDKYHLDPAFAGWLIRMGKIEAVQEWISRYRLTGDGS